MVTLTLLLLLVLLVVKDVNVVMGVIMAVVVIVLSEDIDRSVPLKVRAVRLFCQVNHLDKLVCTLAQINIHSYFQQVLALVVAILVVLVMVENVERVVVVVLIVALLPRLPGLPLLSAVGGCSRSWALRQHLYGLVVSIHAHTVVALAQVLLT